jgi:hypothetical protein
LRVSATGDRHGARQQRPDQHHRGEEEDQHHRRQPTQPSLLQTIRQRIEDVGDEEARQ